jgi:hypothetical protein
LTQQRHRRWELNHLHTACVSQKVLVTGLVVLNCQIGAAYKPDAKGKGAHSVPYISHACLERLKNNGFRVQEPSADAKVTSQHYRVLHFTEEKRFLNEEDNQCRSQSFKALSLLGDKTVFFDKHTCVVKITMGECGNVRQSWSRPLRSCLWPLLPAFHECLFEERLKVFVRATNPKPEKVNVFYCHSKLVWTNLIGHTT